MDESLLFFYPIPPPPHQMDNNKKLQDYGFFFGGRTEVVAVAPGEEGGVGARELGRAMELLEGPEGVIERNVKHEDSHT